LGNVVKADAVRPTAAAPPYRRLPRPHRGARAAAAAAAPTRVAPTVAAATATAAAAAPSVRPCKFGAGDRHRSLKRVSKAVLDTASIKQEPPGRLYRVWVSMGSSIQTPHSTVFSRQDLQRSGALQMTRDY